MGGQFLARGLLVLWIGGQKQAGFQERQPSGHDKVIRRQFQPQRFGLFNKGKVLPGQRQNGNLAQIHLLRARQGQQQVERPFERADVNDKRLGRDAVGDTGVHDIK